MPIPLSDKRTQVQTPRVASGRAVADLEGLQKVGAPALETAFNLVKVVDAGKDMYGKYRSNKDAVAANDAATEYQERLQELNDELNQKQGQNRLDALPEYEAEATKAHQQFKSKIDKVRTANIREQYRHHINAINLRNQSAYDWENYKTQENLDAEATKRFVNTELDRLTQQTTPYDDVNSSVKRLADPNLGLKAGQDAIRRWYSEHLGLPEEVVQGYIENYNTTAINNIATRMNEYEADMGYKNNFSNAINLAKYARDNKLITENAYRTIARPFETQKLDYYVNTYPEKFVDGLGRYNDTLAHQIAPDLNIEERRRAVKQSGSNSGSGAGAGLQNDISEYGVEDLENIIIQNGMADIMNNNRRSLYDIDGATQKRRKNQLGALAPIRIIRAAEMYRNAYYVLENGQYRPLRKGENISQLQQKGAQLIKGSDRKDLQEYKMKATAELQRMMRTGEYKNNLRQLLFKAKNDVTMEEAAAISILQALEKRQTPAEGRVAGALRGFGESIGARGREDIRILSEYEISNIITGAMNGLEKAAAEKGIDLGATHDSYLGTKVNFRDDKGNVIDEQDTYDYLIGAALTSAAINLPPDVLNSLRMEGKSAQEYIAGGRDLTNDFTDPWASQKAYNKASYKYSPAGLFYQAFDAVTGSNQYNQYVEQKEYDKKMTWTAVGKVFNSMKNLGSASGTYTPTKEKIESLGKNVPFKENMPKDTDGIIEYLDFRVRDASNPIDYDTFVNREGTATYESYKNNLAEGANITSAWNILQNNDAFSAGVQMFKTTDPSLANELSDIEMRTTLSGALTDSTRKRISNVLSNQRVLGKQLSISEDTRNITKMEADTPKSTILFTSPNESYIIGGKDKIPHRIDINSNQLYYMVGLQEMFPDNYETQQSQGALKILPGVAVNQDFR